MTTVIHFVEHASSRADFLSLTCSNCPARTTTDDSVTAVGVAAANEKLRKLHVYANPGEPEGSPRLLNLVSATGQLLRHATPHHTAKSAVECVTFREVA